MTVITLGKRGREANVMKRAKREREGEKREKSERKVTEQQPELTDQMLAATQVN